MKSILALVLLAASLSVAQSKPLDNKSLFVDNVTMKTSGEDFANAFALEPACSELTIYLWANRSLDEQHKAVTTAGWWMNYKNPSDGSLNYAGALHRQNPSFYFSIAAKNDRAAVRQVCFIMKGKGGKVR